VAPDCLLCPLQQQCAAYLTGRQHLLPVKAKKAPVRNRYFNYLVFRKGNQLAMRERVGQDIWQSLYDFYLLETDEPKATLRELVPTEAAEKLVEQSILAAPPVAVSQLLSHQRINGMVYLLDVPEEVSGPLPDGLRWYSLAEVEQLPKPVLITNYLAKNIA
jgi:A/G-specific adenine glycosylase